MVQLRTLLVAALLASEAVDALKMGKPKTNKETKKGVERELRKIVGSMEHRPSQAVKIDATGTVTRLSPEDLATSSGKNRELKEYLDAKKADIRKTQKEANKASSTGTSDSKKQWKMKRFQKVHPAEQACLTDARNTLLSKKDMEERHAILKNIQPWKFENATMEAYQETPKIEKVFYINGGDKRRQQFMERQLKSSTVSYNKWPATLADDVDKMPVNGGVPQHCWDYSSGGMAEYLQKMDIDSVLGTVGVYLSHSDLLNHIDKHYNTSDGLFAIMEDDAELSKGWEKKLLQSVKTLPEDWDIARFVFWGGKRCQDAVPPSTNASATEWYEARGPDTVGETNMYAGNQAYLVRPKSIPYILATLRDMPVMDIDGALGSTHKTEMKKMTDGSTVALNWGIHTYVRELPLGTHKYFEATLTETGGSKRLATKLPGSIETHAWGDGSKTKGLDRLKDPLAIAEDLGFKTPEYANWGR